MTPTLSPRIINGIFRSFIDVFSIGDLVKVNKPHVL